MLPIDHVHRATVDGKTLEASSMKCADYSWTLTLKDGGTEQVRRPMKAVCAAPSSSMRFVLQSRRLVVSLCASAVERCQLSSQFSLTLGSLFRGKKKREKIAATVLNSSESATETHFYTDPVSDIQCRLEN